MIKLTKGQIPQVLAQNQATWTAELDALVRKYGSYATIPEKERDAVLKHYRHEDIKNALEQDPGGKKCVYCESFLGVTSFSNIEHFYPKSLYHLRTFCWDNLFMSCTVCNIPKDNFDTLSEPFIHPLNDDPEEYLTFDELRVIPVSQNPNSVEYKKADNVIAHCKLWRRSLTDKYAQFLGTFYDYEKTLRHTVNHFNSLVRPADKRKVAINILESLTTLKRMASVDAEYAGYMRYLLRKFDVIHQSAEILNQYPGDLVPDTGFDWGFIY